MSGSIRTRIGQTRRRLRMSRESVQTMMTTMASDEMPLGERTDVDLLADTALVFSYRTPFVKTYRALIQDHDAWISLRTSTSEEEKEYTTYIGKYGDYTQELQEASDILTRVDALLEKFLTECRSRDLSVPEADDDALTSVTGRSDTNAPTPRPRSSVAFDVTAPSLPGRTATKEESRGVSTEVLEVAARPAPITIATPPPPPPEVIYVQNDSASAFVTAALVGKSLLQFNGDILLWPEFYEAFTSLVRHGNIAGGDKLALLRMCLSGEAQEVIAGLSQLDRNYDHAIFLLQKEYDKPVHRHHALLTRLRNLPNCDRDGRNLRPFYLKLNVLLRQLLPNGEMDSPDLLVNMITSKLPVGMQTRVIKESSRKTDFGVYSLLAILADAVEDERIERDIMAASRSEKRVPPALPVAHSTVTATSPGTAASTKSSRRRKPNRFSDGPRACRLCEGSHGEESCTTYTTPEDRRTAVFQRRLCMNCLLQGHRASECPSTWRCMKCKEIHHTSTCKNKSMATTVRQGESTPRPKPSTPIAPSGKPAPSGKTSSPRTVKQQTHCVLSEELYDDETTMTAVQSHPRRDVTQPLLCLDIDLQSPYNPEKIVRATVIFDTASTCSYVSSDLAAALELPPADTRRVALRTFGKKTVTHRTVNVFPVSVPLTDGSTYAVTCLSSPLICGDVTWIKKENGLFATTTSTPQLLLGSDYFMDLYLGDNFSMSRSEEGYFILTTAIGDIAATKKVSRSTLQTILVNPVTESHPDLSRLEEMVHRHFSLEMMGVTDSPAVDADDGRALAHFLDHIRYDAEEKRYYVALPFREENPQLPTNFGLAFKRLVTVVNGLAQRPENLEKYGAIFAEQLRDGILEEVPADELQDRRCPLPISLRNSEGDERDNEASCSSGWECSFEGEPVPQCLSPQRSRDPSRPAGIASTSAYDSVPPVW